MPDLMNYKVTRIANASVNIPRWQIEGQILTDDQKRVLVDITANNIIFPNVLGNLTQPQQNEWVENVVKDLIFKRFGLG